MKRILIIIILLMLTGCADNLNNVSPEKLSQNDDTTKSMERYYTKDLKYLFEGDFFEVKANDFLTIIPEGLEREYYHYQLLIAPRTDQELVIKSIKILPNDDLIEYFDLNLLPYNGFQSLDSLMKSPSTDIEYHKPSDFFALEYNVTVDNNGTDNIEKSGFEKVEFDELMKDVKLEIKYSINDKESEEIIPMNFEETIIVNSKAIATNYPQEVLNVYLNNEVLNSFGVLE